MRRNILMLTLAIIIASCTGFMNNKGAESGSDWLVNLDEAVELSQKTGKPILANFTGSDWCGWCKKLKAEVFDTPEFKKWASENVVLLELDFPRRTAISDELRMQNRQLQRQFGVRGYPTIHFFNAEKTGEGEYTFSKVGQSGYLRGGSAAWIADASQKLGL